MENMTVDHMVACMANNILSGRVMMPVQKRNERVLNANTHNWERVNSVGSKQPTAIIETAILGTTSVRTLCFSVAAVICCSTEGTKPS
jgi:hypothetical protein